MSDSEEVEKVLQSLASEKSGNYEATADGDTDTDKVEELLRQIEQEKENNTSEANTLDEEPKHVRPAMRKPNGTAKAGDKPAGPKRKSPENDIPKPWKVKGVARKKDQDSFFVVSAKDPFPLPETQPTSDDVDASRIAPQSPPHSPSSHEKNNSPSTEPRNSPQNGVHLPPSTSTPAPTSPAYTSASTPSPTVSRSTAVQNDQPPATPPPQSKLSTDVPADNGSPIHVPANAGSPTHATLPHSTSPAPQSTSPVPHSTSPAPQSTSPVPQSPPPTITFTSSTPPPAQRTPHDPTPKKEAVMPHTNSSDTPTKHRTADELLLDDNIKGDEAVFSKRDVENIRAQIMKQASEETAILAQEFQEIKQKYDDEVRGKTKLKGVLAEYEKTIAKLIDEAGMSGHHEGLAERVVELDNENKRKTAEYDAIVLALSELKARYEDTKTENEKLKSNEQVQKETVSKLQNELQGSETRFNSFKNHAETKLDSASEQLIKIKDDRAKEVAVLQARTQKAEARTAALEKENQEFLVICNDLMKQLEEKNSGN